MFGAGLRLQLIREVKLLSYEGKTIPKKELQEIDEAAKIADSEVKAAYERFVKYENMLLLKSWTDDLVEDSFSELHGLTATQKQEETEKAGGGMVSYIGSWLGALGGSSTSAGVPPAGLDEKDLSGQSAHSAQLAASNLPSSIGAGLGTIEAGADDGDLSFDEADFYDAIEEHTNQIEQASVQIYNDFVRSDAASVGAFSLLSTESLAKLSLGFTLQVFSLSLIDDSNVFDVTDPAKQDVRYLYEYNEILTETRGLNIEFKHYDADNAKNELELEAEVRVADLNVTYVQEVNAADNSKLIQKRHKVVWRRNDDKDLVDVSFVGINKKLKELKKAESPLGKSADQPDQVLNARLQGIYFEYRKEYIEFFMTFFTAEEAIKDELKLKAMEEYEKLREAVSVAALLEQREKMASSLQLNVELEPAVALFPIFGHKGDAMQAKEFVVEQPLSPNYLYDMKGKPSWLAVTGPVRFHNHEDPEVPKVDGVASFSLRLSPSLVFAENLEDFWSHEDPGKLTAVLHQFSLKSNLKIKDSEHKFEDTYSVPEFAMDFHLARGNLYLSPLIYCHLLNIVDVFVRPHAASGDEAKLKYNER